MGGLQWLLCQEGWDSSRIEEEVAQAPSTEITCLQVLPLCWEQVSHKHPERRQLVAQVGGGAGAAGVSCLPRWWGWWLAGCSPASEAPSCSPC